MIVGYVYPSALLKIVEYTLNIERNIFEQSHDFTNIVQNFTKHFKLKCQKQQIFQDTSINTLNRFIHSLDAKGSLFYDVIKKQG